jgi:hypothetical protein
LPPQTYDMVTSKLKELTPSMVHNSTPERIQTRANDLATKATLAGKPAIRGLSQSEWAFTKAGWNYVVPLTFKKYPIATKAQLLFAENILEKQLSLPHCIVTSIRGITGIKGGVYHTDPPQSGVSVAVINASEATYEISFYEECTGGRFAVVVAPWSYYLMARKYRMIYKHAVRKPNKHNIISIGFINMDEANDKDIDSFGE